jgi:hypothetical protein
VVLNGFARTTLMAKSRQSDWVWQRVLCDKGQSAPTSPTAPLRAR